MDKVIGVIAVLFFVGFVSEMLVALGKHGKKK